MPIRSTPMKHYTAYVDEAGDEGFGKLAGPAQGGQSRWLVIGACVVEREYDLEMPAWRDSGGMASSRDSHFAVRRTYIFVT